MNLAISGVGPSETQRLLGHAVFSRNPSCVHLLCLLGSSMLHCTCVVPTPIDLLTFILSRVEKGGEKQLVQCASHLQHIIDLMNCDKWWSAWRFRITIRVCVITHSLTHALTDAASESSDVAASSELPALTEVQSKELERAYANGQFKMQLSWESWLTDWISPTTRFRWGKWVI